MTSMTKYVHQMVQSSIIFHVIDLISNGPVIYIFPSNRFHYEEKADSPCSEFSGFTRSEKSYFWQKIENMLKPLLYRYSFSLALINPAHFRGAVQTFFWVNLGFCPNEGGGGSRQSQLFIKIAQNLICLGTVHKCDETHST